MGREDLEPKADRDLMQIGRWLRCAWQWLKRDPNNIIAIGTIVLGVIGTGSLFMTCHQIHTEARAWVGTTGVYFTQAPAPNESISVTVSYRNVGASPALNFTYNPALHLGGPLPDDANDVQAPKNNTCSALPEETTDVFPDHDYEFEVQTQWKFAASAISALFHGSDSLFLLGCFRYQDVFGSTHQTKFCEFYDPRLNVWRICKTGNDAN